MTDSLGDVNILLPILKQIPLFANLDEKIHREIIEAIVLMYYPDEHEIFAEGDEGDALYIVKKGSVMVYHPPKEEGDMPDKMAEINQGGFFGEMALISDEPRIASVKTMQDSEVFILKKDSFKKLMDSNTTLAEQVSATMVSRLNENDKQV